MPRIPEALLDAPEHRSLRLEDASVTWYRVAPPPPPGRFLVTQPTLSFVRTGIKHLQPYGEAHPVIASAGSVVAMRAGVHTMTELSGDEGAFESIILSVSPVLLRGLLGSSGASQKREAVATAAVPPRVYALLDDLGTGSDASLRIREALLVAASAPAVRELLYAAASQWGTSDAERLRAVMQSHFLTPLALPEYALLAAMSLSTFKRRFREVFGESPGRWLRQARLQHARWLLLTEQSSVTDACYGSGFGDLSNFIRAFRGQFGFSPRAYRLAHLSVSGSTA